MKKNSRSFLFIYLIVVLIFGIAIISPVVATDLRVNISLGKTYAFKLANVSQINVIDIGDYSMSRVDINSTSGSNDDIKVINTPTINKVIRNFTSTTGKFNGVTVTVEGTNPSTVHWINKPNFTVYTKYTIPTFLITHPGGHTGNPLVTKYNESWSKEDTDNLDSLFRSSESVYLYDSDGVVLINTTNNEYTGVGGFSDPTRYKNNNITYTLQRNLQSLSPFVADQSSSQDLGLNPKNLPTKGKYYISAIHHVEPVWHNVTVQALSPVIILPQDTTMQATAGGNKFTDILPPYTKGTSGPVILNFSPSNTDVANIKNITYTIIDKAAVYDMNITIDTSVLAKNAEQHWQAALPTYHFSELLYSAITTDIGPGWNYTLTANGQVSPPPSTEWSVIAITPGYGISGSVKSNETTIPDTNINTLNDGVYYLYLMGTDDKNDVIAIDQKEVTVNSGGPAIQPVLNVRVKDVAGVMLGANNITLFNSTWNDNTTWSGLDFANFDGLALGEQYTVRVNKTGYVNVSGDVTVTGENPRWVNVTLAQLGELTTPRVVLSENGTMDNPVVDSFYLYPNAVDQELSLFNYTVTGQDRAQIAVEFQMRRFAHANILATKGVVVNVSLGGDTSFNYTIINGTWYMATPNYITTNATLVVDIPPMSEGKQLNITIWGSVLGDANGDGVANTVDKSAINYLYSGRWTQTPAYDYFDIGRTGAATTGDKTKINYVFSGRMNKYYVLV